MSSELAQPRSTMTTGAHVIANALKEQGVQIVFGIVGIPVVEVADACTQVGIRFIGFRNEQSAAYAATAYGYLSGRPGVCLTVGGPGVVHALAGLLNAKLNCWPMVLLAGSCDSDQIDMGAFQELEQVEVCRPYCKHAARPNSVDRIPTTIEKAYRTAMAGRPGPAYVDLPADFIQHQLKDAKGCPLVSATEPARSQADPRRILEAVHLLSNAKRPLIVIGKGAAYARAEKELGQLVDQTQFPFLPTPMGKGVVPDDHTLCVSAARSKALREADVVLLVGARLNWILHYGQAPRWSPNVHYIHIEVEAEELGNNQPSLALLGDIRLVVQQLLDKGVGHPNTCDKQYVAGLQSTVTKNVAKIQASGQTGSDHAVLTYHTAFAVISSLLPQQEVVYISEGANTMDIARSFFDVRLPRHRLDAGTGATMGVGMGYAIAAQLYYATKRVVAIVGDSAFGFSAMELETAIRANLPLLIIVINNNGIYNGLASDEYEQARRGNTLPSTSLSPETRYDLIAKACGGRGWLVQNRVELKQAVQEALGFKSDTCLINVMISPGGRKKLEFGWMNKSAKI